MTDVPDIIRAALVEARRGHDQHHQPPHKPVADQHIARGDVRVVTPPAGAQERDARLCLVIRTDPADEFADVVLVHSAPELATSIDGVVAGELTGTPYDLVIETDLRGAVWTFQIGKRVGRVDDELLDALSSIVSGDRAAADPALADHAAAEVGPCETVRTGTPLLGQSDRRWQFKRDEGDVFRALSAECTSMIIDGGTFWVLDPELIRSGHLEGVADPDIIDELWQWRCTRRSRPLTITDEVLDEMLGQPSLSPRSGADLGLELAGLAWELALDVATTRRIENRPVAPRGLVTTRFLLRAEHASFHDVYLLGERASS